MSDGVPQVEGFADAVFVGVLLYDVLFDLYGASHQLLEAGVVGVAGVEVQQFCPMGNVAYQSVFQHFGIAGEEVVAVQRAQEFGFEQYILCRIESSDFIFQPVVVYACFASYGSIDHGEQCGGQVDVGYAPLERGGGKAPQVGYHASAKVDKQAVAGGSPAAECLPYGGKGVEILMQVFGGDGDFFGALQGGDVRKGRQAEPVGMLVGQDEKFVVGATLDGLFQIFPQFFAQYHFLSVHNVG